ncbi:hypothetical protein [Alteromonas confluentis]|uniref:Uncharacterized protein n=1 Tax=Alteromonas confluentis TaxID=1656094 RepID=A0A1E7ZAD9_9ALTE|nr:hypothetical protein [Alteromonas confluentis]OFC70422.1 hypothetical protein BFC18_14760 [Alteromonas confluentis]
MDKIAALKALLGDELHIEELIRNSISSYDDFIERLSSDIDNIVEDMQRHRENHPKDTLEDNLTNHILANLRTLGYSAEPENKSGNADMCVKRKNFMWLGEAKKHSGDYQYLADGMHQLSTRYSLSTPSANHGGLIIYIHEAKGAGISNEWRKRLREQKLIGLETYSDLELSDCRKNTFCFLSSHTHHSSGIKYNVRHIPIFLHHDPIDKSARRSKKNRK